MRHSHICEANMQCAACATPLSVLPVAFAADQVMEGYC